VRTAISLSISRSSVSNPDLAGVGLQLGQQPAPTRTGLVDE
jgi:hypothetical protein